MSKLHSLWTAAALVLITVSTAFAADGELRWADLGWRVLNIILFVAILWKFTGKLIVNFLTGRREGIAKNLDDLQQRRMDAKARLAEVEKSIADLATERQAILDESRAQAEAAKNIIIADAHRQAEQIMEQAKRNAQNEARGVLMQVRATIADEIVDAAEKVLESKLDEAKHDKLINNSLTKVVLN